MGMLATWIHQATTPLRDLRWSFYRLKDELWQKLFRTKRMATGLTGDVRSLARSAGAVKKPNLPPIVPPKYPPKR